MPVITIKVSASRSIQLTNKIAGMVSGLTQRILHKDPALTAIVIEYVEPEDWVVGGRSLALQGKGSVYLDWSAATASEGAGLVPTLPDTQDASSILDAYTFASADRNRTEWPSSRASR